MDRKAEFAGGEGRKPGRAAFARQHDLGLIKDLDGDLLRLINKRTAVLDRLRDKGHLPSALEKELRVAWETKVHNQSRDNKLARDIFVLLQALEPGTMDREQPWFNLCPSTAPVEVNLACAADSFWARCHMALAAAGGQPMRLPNVPLSDVIIECCKTLNQMGASLWWENPQTICHREAKGLPGGLDKMVYVGEDDFNLWLALALSLGRISQIKFVGGQKAHVLGLSKLKNWLPGLGARLFSLVPSQDGLPVRLESSGLLPPEVELDPELPLRFICALVLAAPFWDSPVVFKLREMPDLLAEMAAMLTRYGAHVKVLDKAIAVAPAWPQLPAEPSLPPDLGVAANFLSLPAFCQGEARLTGNFNLAGPELELVQTLLTQAGLSVDIRPEQILTKRNSAGASPAFAPDLLAGVLARRPELFPLMVSLSARWAWVNGSCPFSLPENPNDDLIRILDSFLAQLGLAYVADAKALIRSDEPKTPAWLSPNAWWAMAFGWAALFRPNLLLVNPGVLTSDYPPFWQAYNSLPRPEIGRKPKEEPLEPKPARRRIIAPGTFQIAPPEPAGERERTGGSDPHDRSGSD